MDKGRVSSMIEDFEFQEGIVREIASYSKPKKRLKQVHLRSKIEVPRDIRNS